MAVYNPRHPHTCTIFRMVNEDEFSKGKRQILYEGPCRKYQTRNARTSDRTLMSQYTLSIPSTELHVVAGDRVEVTDMIGSFEGVIAEVQCGNLGSFVYWSDYKR